MAFVDTVVAMSAAGVVALPTPAWTAIVWPLPWPWPDDDDGAAEVEVRCTTAALRPNDGLFCTADCCIVWDEGLTDVSACCVHEYYNYILLGCNEILKTWRPSFGSFDYDTQRRSLTVPTAHRDTRTWRSRLCEIFS